MFSGATFTVLPSAVSVSSSFTLYLTESRMVSDRPDGKTKSMSAITSPESNGSVDTNPITIFPGTLVLTSVVTFLRDSPSLISLNLRLSPL